MMPAAGFAPDETSKSKRGNCAQSLMISVGMPLVDHRITLRARRAETIAAKQPALQI
jgi:hypothetical protein